MASSLDDFPRLDARRANGNRFGCAFYLNFNPLDIGLETPPGDAGSVQADTPGLFRQTVPNDTVPGM